MKVYVAGHRGMVGSAIVRKLIQNGCSDNIITRSHSELDLVNQKEVEEFFLRERPDVVYLAAAKVGGIHANSTYPAEFIYQNLMIASNVINAAYKNNVKKLLYLGSSCIYPKFPNIPISENQLLTSVLEPTNEAYAIAKIAGIKLCQYYNSQYGTDYRCVMPTNLYGPGDNYHPENSHVLPGLIQKFHAAKTQKLPSVKVWGNGQAYREFLHVDDLASACLYVMENKAEKSENGLIMFNIGSGEEVRISELANLIKKVVGYEGDIEYDLSKPNGTPRKLLDSSKLIKLGWRPQIPLERGIRMTYSDFITL
jgi:GDP-L-fucose synthase